MRVKLTPIIDVHDDSTRLLNLTVLRRFDPLIVEIINTAGHVTLYDFNVKTNEWSRKDVEGTMFVVKRNGHPRFQFIVMNRKSTENLVEDLLGDFEFEVQIPYIFYCNVAEEVTGVWFYDSSECEKVGGLFSRITKAYSNVPSKLKEPALESGFEEPEAAPTSSETKIPSEPPISATTMPDIPHDSFATGDVDSSLNPAISESPPGASSIIPGTSHATNVISTALPTVQSSSFLPTSSAPNISTVDAHESRIEAKISATNLVKPSFFSTTPSSSSLTMPPLFASIPTAPPLYPPLTMQHPNGTPLLKPFPPSTPSASLTSPSTVVTREKVRDALLRLVQNRDFIEMVYLELIKT